MAIINLNDSSPSAPPPRPGRKLPAEGEAEALLQRVRTGNDEAIQELYHRYLDRLTALVRRKLAEELPRAAPLGFSAQDVARSAFNRFIAWLRRDPTAGIQDDGHLWSILAQFVDYRARNVIRAARRREAGCRWAPLHGGACDGEDAGAVDHLADSGLAFDEPDYEALLRQLVDALAGHSHALRTLRLLLEGWSIPRIAAELDRGPRSVELYIQAIKAKVKEICA